MCMRGWGASGHGHLSRPKVNFGLSTLIFSANEVGGILQNSLPPPQTGSVGVTEPGTSTAFHTGSGDLNSGLFAYLKGAFSSNPFSQSYSL